MPTTIPIATEFLLPQVENMADLAAPHQHETGSSRATVCSDNELAEGTQHAPVGRPA